MTLCDKNLPCRLLTLIGLYLPGQNAQTLYILMYVLLYNLQIIDVADLV